MKSGEQSPRPGPDRPDRGALLSEDTAFPRGNVFLPYPLFHSSCSLRTAANVLGFIIGYASGTAGAVYTLDVHPFIAGGHRQALIAALEKELSSEGRRPCGWRRRWKSRRRWSCTAKQDTGSGACAQLLRAGKACPENQQGAVDPSHEGRGCPTWRGGSTRDCNELSRVQSRLPPLKGECPSGSSGPLIRGKAHSEADGHGLASLGVEQMEIERAKRYKDKQTS